MESMGHPLRAGILAHYIAPHLDAGKISITEAQARAFSWGLMQVMGRSPANTISAWGPQRIAAPLSQLCDAVTGLEIGCTVFAAKLFAAHNDVSRALQLWNGGGNPSYAGASLARLANYPTG